MSSSTAPTIGTITSQRRVRPSCDVRFTAIVFDSNLRNVGSVHLNLVPEFSPGLEGVVAAETAVSEVDGANGRLIYRGGYLIEDLAKVASFEETSYLLWNGALPDKRELETLRHQMAAARRLKDSARDALKCLEADTDPMDVLRTIVSAQGAAKAITKPTLDEAIALTA